MLLISRKDANPGSVTRGTSVLFYNVSTKWVRRIALINVIVNVIIVLTGGAVRLTDSGMGCASWPNCTPETFFPTPAMGIHSAIEWSNRLFGGVVTVVALAAFIAALLRRPRRKSLVWLTFSVGLGVIVQALIGAVTVGTVLSPYMVSVHFLVSMAVLAVAYAAWVRAGEPDGEARALAAPAVVWLWRSIAAVTLVTLTAGTVVTGAGPRAGDANAPRLAIDEAAAAQAHADLACLLIGLSVGLVFAAFAAKVGPRTRRAAIVLVVVEAAQGLIGLVQYLTDLPVALVAAHMLGAALLWLAVLAVGTSLRHRLPRPLEAATVIEVTPTADDEEDDAEEPVAASAT